MKKILAVAVITSSAQLMVLPVAMLCFGTVTLLSVLANVLLSWLISALLVLGLVIVLFAPFTLLRPLAIAAAWLAGGIARLCVLAAQQLAQLPYAQTSVSRVEVFVFIGLAGIAALILFAVRNRYLKRILAVAICIVIVLSAGLCAVNSNRITVIAISKKCTVISYRGNTAVIGGCSTDYEQDLLRQALSSLCVDSVDLLDVHNCTTETVAATAARCSAEKIIVPHDRSRPIEGAEKMKNNGITVALDSMTAEIYLNHAVIVADGIRIAVADNNTDLSTAEHFDYIICRGKTVANADGWIMYSGANALAIGAKRVYNSNANSFTLRIDRYFGIVSQ